MRPDENITTFITVVYRRVYTAPAAPRPAIAAAPTAGGALQLAEVWGCTAVPRSYEQRTPSKYGLRINPGTSP